MGRYRKVMRAAVWMGFDLPRLKPRLNTNLMARNQHVGVVSWAVKDNRRDQEVIVSLSNASLVPGTSCSGHWSQEHHIFMPMNLCQGAGAGVLAAREAFLRPIVV
jgi:hypothetical protein